MCGSVELPRAGASAMKSGDSPSPHSTWRFAEEQMSRDTRSRTFLTGTFALTLADQPLHGTGVSKRCAWLEILQPKSRIMADHSEGLVLRLLHRHRLAHAFRIPRSASAVNAATLRC